MILAQSLFTLETLLPLALFGTFAALAWWGLDLIAAGKSRTAERLDELKNPRKREQGEDLVMKRQDRMTQVLEKA